LRPFGCHVMILNTLDHLGKFDAKGDEGHFVRYSQSSKVFRVFNKRTKKVEENLHVDFLENKLIEKGAGPNWNIDAPDGCNADDPESSRIYNPIATSKVPSAEQVEPAVSLTVETKIPTVSSPVPTVCLDISPESSSDPRLISKGDFSQKETPSLDNTLTLLNSLLDFKIHPDRVYKVEKAMYGLHQAPRAWYGTLSKYLLDMAFKRLCREFEALMHDKFQMSAMGELNFFLGLQVLQKKDGIFLSQDKYIGDILKKFGYSDVRSANTPMDKENP
nr:hypothetical protein [Tanacetum cinerariifolium]